MRCSPSSFGSDVCTPKFVVSRPGYCVKSRINSPLTPGLTALLPFFHPSVIRSGRFLEEEIQRCTAHICQKLLSSEHSLPEIGQFFLCTYSLGRTCTLHLLRVFCICIFFNCSMIRNGCLGREPWHTLRSIAYQSNPMVGS